MSAPPMPPPQDPATDPPARSASDPQLLAKLRARRRSAHAPSAQPRLTSLQRQVWFDEALNPGVRNYTTAFIWRVDGPLDLTVLADAIADVSRDQDALRLTLRAQSGEPTVTFSPTPTFGLEVETFPSDSPSASPLAWAEHRAAVLVHEPIWMADPALARITCLVGPDTRFLVLRLHHALTDRMSNALIIRHLSKAYATRLAGQSETQTPAPSYEQVLRRAPSPDAPRAEFPVLAWPVPDRRDFARAEGIKHRRSVSVSIANRLQSLARAHNASLYGVLAAAYQVTLAAYCDQRDISIGVSRSTRTDKTDDATFGFFLENIVIRAELTPETRLIDLARSVTHSVGRQIGDIGFRSTKPLSTTCILYREDEPKLQLDQTTVTPWSPPTYPNAVDLHLGLYQSDDGLECCFEGRCGLFTSRDLRALAESYETIIDQFAAAPVIQLGDLTFHARSAILPEVPTGYIARPACMGSIADQFRAIAKAYSGAPALREGDARWSYAALDDETDRLAQGMMDQGLLPGDRVGLLLPRGAELIQATVAVLKVGAVVVPIDTRHTGERVAQCLTQAKCRWMIAQVIDGIVALDPILSPDVKPLALTRSNQRAECVPITADNPAYVLFTSGSTGTPKGALTPHRAVLRLARHLIQPQIGPGDRTPQVASPSFDGALSEIWPTLLNGAELVAPAQPLDSLAAFKATLKDNAATHLALSTSIFNALVDYDLSSFETLRWVVIGGEAMSPSHAARFLERYPDTALVNGYGPTENGALTTLYAVHPAPEGAVPIGTLLPNTLAFVVSDTGRPVPKGFAGELWIGGEGLSTGYVDAPELTDRAFLIRTRAEMGVAGAGEVLLYRTGDRVRWNADEQLEYLGRLQSFVKFNGYRVEPDEVAREIAALSLVKAATVLPIFAEDGITVRRLAGFYVTDQADLTSGDLRKRLVERIPRYLLPSPLIRVERLPLTINGKVDHKALLEVYASHMRNRTPKVAPNTAEHKALSAIWARILDVRTPGLEDDIFLSGGDSLSAMALLAEVEKVTGRAIDSAAFLENPTLGALIELATKAELSESAGQKYVFQMRAGSGTKPPILFVFGHLGEPSWANHIAPKIDDDRVVYGIRMGPPAQWNDRNLTLRSMAQTLAKDVAPVVGDRAFHLAGYSFAGMLTFELAAQLQADGCKLGRVFLMDAGLNFASSDQTVAQPDPVTPSGLLLSLWRAFKVAPAPLHVDCFDGSTSFPMPSDALSSLWTLAAAGGVTRHQTRLSHDDFYGKTFGPTLATQLNQLMDSPAEQVLPNPAHNRVDWLPLINTGRHQFARKAFLQATQTYRALQKSPLRDSYWLVSRLCDSAYEAGDMATLRRLVLRYAFTNRKDPHVNAAMAKETRRQKWYRLSLFFAKRSLEPGQPGNVVLVLALANRGKLNDAFEMIERMRATAAYGTDSLAIECALHAGLGNGRAAVESAMKTLRRSDVSVRHILFLGRLFSKTQPEIARRLYENGLKKFSYDEGILSELAELDTKSAC